MIKTPAYLKAGDTIGLTCPAGYMSFDKASACIRMLEQWGYKVKMGNTLGSGSKNYFSGTDKERLTDFQNLLDDNEVKAILCARGGYGTSRIIDSIDFKQFAKYPKWIIGYSDITILHAHIYSNFKIASLHSPMAGAFNDAFITDELTGKRKVNEYINSLRNAIEGKKAKYSCTGHEFNRKGEAVGELVGGNLSLLIHLIGSESDMKTKGRILFLEDVGEQLYNVDRMFVQLKRAGKLDKLAGLIIGGFTDMKDTERPFGQSVYELIRDKLSDYSYPVCYDFPVSHDTENLALKVGVGYKLTVGKSRVVLEE
ncbi:MAG: LD-carboxypeptidase [Chitinophagaceae bacterium]|nr:LD-carboxypeptidase [Chitinophagaceae bacterium]